MWKLLSSLIIVAIFNGCATPEPEIIIKTEPVILLPPKILLKVEPVPEPIIPEMYVNMSAIEREMYLTELIINLYGSLGNSNLRINELNEWYSKSKDSIESIHNNIPP